MPIIYEKLTSEEKQIVQNLLKKQSEISKIADIDMYCELNNCTPADFWLKHLKKEMEAFNRLTE